MHFIAATAEYLLIAEPEGARKWFPCWDKPSDKATYDMTESSCKCKNWV